MWCCVFVFVVGFFVGLVWWVFLNFFLVCSETNVTQKHRTISLAPRRQCDLPLSVL